MCGTHHPSKLLWSEKQTVPPFRTGSNEASERSARVSSGLSGSIPLGGLRMVDSGMIPHGWPPLAKMADHAFLHIFEGVKHARFESTQG
jgi:hypothetical protein